MAKLFSEPDLEPTLHWYRRRRELRVKPKGVQRAISKAHHVQETHLIEPEEHEGYPLSKRYETLIQYLNFYS